MTEPAERRNPPAEFLYANKWRIFGVMMIGWAMSLLDVSIVNVSIPELQDEMSTDIATVTWVINAYNITFAVLLVSMGRLADQFGRKRFFIIGLTVFTIGSALCAAAWSVEWLMAFRVIQGAGAGILAPLGFAMTVLVFPPERRGFGLALIAVVALVSSALGPVIGGAVVEIASWHWIFLINIPFGIIGVILALRWWPETWDLTAAGKTVDVKGMALLGGAVFMLTVALVEANPFGGDLPLWLSLMQGAILLGILFVWWERRAPDPMIPPGLLANRQFRSANLGMLFFAAGAIGSLLLLSLMFVNLWGYTQLEAALAITPMPLCGLLAWPFMARAADTRPPGELAKPALVLMALGMLIVSFMPSTAGDAWAYLRVLPGLLLIGAGMGIGFPALNVGAMGAVSGQELGVASGILNTARQLGAAIGVAVLIATFGGALHAHMSWFAEDEIEDVVDDWEIPPAIAGGVIQGTLHDYTGGTSDRFQPGPGFDEEIIRETAGAAREGFAWAFRQAALLVLSALPLMGALKRTPGQARAEAMAAMKAAGAPPGQGPPPGGGPAGDGDGDGVQTPRPEPRPA
ncbi:MAG TPA: MFS transporter [Thermoleophilaceae bacterium]|nr:MFS transporter [Thermoleophilaceae bacterium]